MSLTTNQGLTIPNGTDNANVPLSFTNYNTALENRLVQRYLSIADRTARNGAPNEGELSWLSDLDRYEYWTGSAWISLLPLYAQGIDGSTFTTTSVPYTTVGAPTLGSTITAPQSGIVKVEYSAFIDNNTLNQTTLVAPQLNTGSTIGGGATFQAASDGNSVRIVGDSTTGGAIQSSSFVYFTGLTPGSPYNAFLMHRVTAGTGTVGVRAIDITQK